LTESACEEVFSLGGEDFLIPLARWMTSRKH